MGSPGPGCIAMPPLEGNSAAEMVARGTMFAGSGCIPVVALGGVPMGGVPYGGFTARGSASWTRPGIAAVALLAVEAGSCSKGLIK